MGKNIVICCDGTSNEIKANLSNVLKLYRVLIRNEHQLVFYDPGIGTLGNSDPWSRLKNNAYRIFGLATGAGLDTNVLDCYRFLIDAYEKGDKVYLFGFSRGAYTVRVLAGFLRLVGLLAPFQKNLAGYALVAYKTASEENEFEIAWRFAEIARTRLVHIKFLGVWDTVSSMIVPRPDRFYIPSLEQLPYTRTNSLVEVVRHATAIDERRRLFRLNRWIDRQTFQPNPFDHAADKPQDIKQVWFCGDHSDVGGGYPEIESGLAKFPLKWMIDEAAAQGVVVNSKMYRHLVLGEPQPDEKKTYVKPDFKARLHNSLTWGWWPLEVIPKRAKWREWPARPKFLGMYLPLGEPRVIPSGARVHQSVVSRHMELGYQPINLPPMASIIVEPDQAPVLLAQPGPIERHDDRDAGSNR